MHEELNVSHRRRWCSHCFCPEVTAPRSSFKIQHSRFINVLSTIIFYISSSRNWMCSRLSVPFQSHVPRSSHGRHRTHPNAVFHKKKRRKMARKSVLCLRVIQMIQMQNESPPQSRCQHRKSSARSGTVAVLKQLQRSESERRRASLHLINP